MKTNRNPECIGCLEYNPEGCGDCDWLYWSEIGESLKHRSKKYLVQSWYHVDDRTPAIDEDVIVLDELGVISSAHMVDPKVATGYHGWNIPGVVFWRPCEFTEEIEEYYKQK